MANADPDFVRNVLACRLVDYLQFTQDLEHFLVLRVLADVCRDGAGFQLPSVMRLDAHKIMIDEAYHAMCAADVTNQLAEAQLWKIPETRPVLTGDRIRRVTKSFRGSISHLVPLFLAITSEILITASLKQISTDERVALPVRQMVADHANDEAAHHRYFSTLLRIVWPLISPAEQEQIGRALPDMIILFTGPDELREIEILQKMGVSRSQARGIVAETYTKEITGQSAARAAKDLISILRELGALDLSGVTECFEQRRIFASGST
jgi:hypothetical protein